ncbi:MAG: glycosyltransferase [Chloroflexi bacterium]|nr:glycosyltransferase [Chloroflexota bacterium]
MLGSVPTTPKSLEAYRDIVGDDKIEEIRDLARDLRGARVLHINATAFGGGVAEILATLVPLMKDVGLDVDWQVIRGADEFFNVTKAMHNSLQGMYIPWSAEMFDIWRRYNTLNAELIDQSFDFVVVHDPQPAGLLHLLRQRDLGLAHGNWIWRCHIDLTNAQLDVWDFLRPYVDEYDAAIFTMPGYVKDDLRGPHIAIIPPAIDPLSPKNIDMSIETVAEILREYKVDDGRPMICQVSRFDPWKDPLGVIDVYRLVKQSVPDLQLVMVASMAADDPEGWSYYERTARRAGEDDDIHLLSNLNGVGNIEVNAFQREATVVLQKSIREGFGLVVSEALWKGRPTVAGNVGGIPLQIENARTGYLVDTTDECAERVLYLLQHPKEANEMGERGREHVRENFLITRNLRDYLRLFNRVKAQKAATAART